MIPDFLPSPEGLAFREETVKVTISLSKRSVDFFKSEAGKHRTQYQTNDQAVGRRREAGLPEARIKYFWFVRREFTPSVWPRMDAIVYVGKKIMVIDRFSDLTNIDDITPIIQRFSLKVYPDPGDIAVFADIAGTFDDRVLFPTSVLTTQQA